MQVSPGAASSPEIAMTADCPGRVVFETIANQWSLLILVALCDGELRFHLLRDRVEGISERMLSKNLKELVALGLVARRVEPTVPPRVSYSLTELGRELGCVMAELTAWIGRRLPEIERARAAASRG